MTLDTAKRIKEDQLIQAASINIPDVLKEACAVVRGGMNICENLEDGTHKYTWIKVLPTKTDEESSIKLAMKKYQMKKKIHIKEINQQKVLCHRTAHQQSVVVPSTPLVEAEQDETIPLYKLALKIKKVFYDFVKLMDQYVDE